jgi:hypothetical protein
VALGPLDVKTVQLKAGTARLSRRERARIVDLTLASNVSREYWRFPDRACQPLIERREVRRELPFCDN